MWHDAHNHLQDPLLDPWRDEFLTNREALGVGWQVVNATSESDLDAVARLAARNENILPAYGIHPWEVDGISPNWKPALCSRWDAGGGVGEIGLDRWKSRDNFERQTAIFEWQWGQAIVRGLPATVHCLRAWDALIEIIRRNPHRSPGFLLHAYGGPPGMVAEWVDLGAFFSFSGSFLNPGRERKLEPFRRIPVDRLLIETDAPAMPVRPVPAGIPDPVSADGTPIHHPATLASTGVALAKLRGDDPSKLAAILEENFNRLFRPGVCGEVELR